MRMFEVFFALIPIKISLRMFFLSSEFINFMIYPSLALFLGTGNATPNLPSVMMEVSLAFPGLHAFEWSERLIDLCFSCPCSDSTRRRRTECVSLTSSSLP